MNDDLVPRLNRDDLTFDQRVDLVYELGLVPAWCPQCWCIVGSPACHPVPEIDPDEVQQDGCPSPCPLTTRETTP